MGYPNDILSTRAIVKPGLWMVLPKGGLVNNVIPGIKDCRVSILCSPKVGASFVEYIISTENSGHSEGAFGADEGIESFLYVIEGTVNVVAGQTTEPLTEGGYIFSPVGTGIQFEAQGKATFIFYKQRYVPLIGCEAHVVVGNVNDIEYRIYDDMENVFIKDLLPVDDLGFDMNMHILSFAPGGCHGFAETHVQEHGAYILSGEGVYFMDQQWLPIRKDDFMWFGPYVPQCSYGVGREAFTYIYSKDCNRDAEI